MPFGDGGDFELAFHNCRNWKKTEDLVQALDAMLVKFNFQVLSIPAFSPLSFNTFGKSFSNYCQLSYEIRERNWDENYYPPHADGGLTLRFTIPFIEISSPPIRNYLLMTSSIFGKEYNHVRFKIYQTQKYKSQVIKLFSTISQFLIPRLLPDYVFICEDDEKYQRLVEPKDILDKTVKQIYWANYLSSEILNKDSYRILNSAPVGKIKEFRNGLWYYLHEDFSALTDRNMLSVEDKAMEYFSKSCNIQWVQWRFTSLQ